MVWFSFIVRGGSGGVSTAAAVTLDTGADESGKRMADGVARSPSRLCSRDGKICRFGDALSTICLLAFVPCFLLFVDLFFLSLFFSCVPICLYFSVPLRLCSSHLLLSASTYFYGTCSFCLYHLDPTPLYFVFIRPVYLS